MPANRAGGLARKVLAEVKRAESAREGGKERSPVKVLLLGALSEYLSARSALVLLNRLERTFVDWNEVRVSSPYEIATAMHGNADDLTYAEYIRRVLTRVFDETNDMTLSSLMDKRRSDVTRLIGRIMTASKRSMSKRKHVTRKKAKTSGGVKRQRHSGAAGSRASSAKSGGTKRRTRSTGGASGGKRAATSGARQAKSRERKRKK